VSRVWDKVPEGSTLIFGDTQITLNTAWDRWKEASMPKNQLDSSVVSLQYWLVTDGQTDGHTMTANTMLA